MAFYISPMTLFPGFTSVFCIGLLLVYWKSNN